MAETVKAYDEASGFTMEFSGELLTSSDVGDLTDAPGSMAVYRSDRGHLVVVDRGSVNAVTIYERFADFAAEYEPGHMLTDVANALWPLHGGSPT